MTQPTKEEVETIYAALETYQGEWPKRAIAAIRFLLEKCDRLERERDALQGELVTAGISEDWYRERLQFRIDERDEARGALSDAQQAAIRFMNERDALREQVASLFEAERRRNGA